MLWPDFQIRNNIVRTLKEIPVYVKNGFKS